MRNQGKTGAWSVPMLSLLALFAAPAGAQEAGPAADEDGLVVEEVLVTATRRETSVQSVPVAVQTVTAEALEGGALRDTQALVMEVPSLNITVSGSESSGGVIRIRGVGTAGGNAGLESSVGVFVDGVYLPRPALALNDLVDVERVEVLRGPQGTLYGKNTSMGAIQITTRKPSFTPEAMLGESLGNYGSFIGRGSVSGPVGDKLALRLSGQYNLRDGYIHNQTDGLDYNDRDRYTLRAQALYQASDALSLRLIADRIEKDERCCAAPYSLNGPSATRIAALGGTVFEPEAEYEVAFDSDLYSKAEETGVSWHLDWDLGTMALKGLLSYRKGETDEASDGDYNDLEIAYLPFSRSEIELYTGELSLQGKAGRFDWLVGAFYADEDIGVETSTLLGDDAAAFLGAPSALYPSGSGQTLTAAQQSGQSWSLFTHNVVDLGAGFDLTVGLRYLREEKEGAGLSVSTSPSCVIPGLPAAARLLCGAPLYEIDYDDDRLTGVVAVGKKLGEATYVYASYSNGFKSGAINLNPPTTVAGNYLLQPEKVDAYELGLKTQLFDRRWLTRWALFHMDIQDYQLNTFDGISNVASNADVQSAGVEFESSFRLARGLDLRASATYADAEYGDETERANLRGRQLTNAPHWVGQFGASYLRPLPLRDVVLFANAVARYQSDVNTGLNLAPQKAQGEYTLVNGRIGLQLPTQFEVSLWGANLLDEHYYLIIFDSVAQPGSFNGYSGVPRTYGFEVTKRF